MLPLEGKVAIVTGAGRYNGIGRHIALALARQGADIANAEQVQRLVEETRRELGRIDILVNNAAAARGRDRVPVVQLEEAEWRKVIEVNLTGTFLMTKAIAQGPIRNAVMRSIPLGREGNPEEIGELVAFLCGPDASYVHGQAINIDGGRVMQ